MNYGYCNYLINTKPFYFDLPLKTCWNFKPNTNFQDAQEAHLNHRRKSQGAQSALVYSLA